MRKFFRNLAMWAFHLGFVRPVLSWFIGVRYRRKGLIPEGPCIVVSNHNSHLDAALLMSLFPLRRLPTVHPVAAADYFGTSWLKRTLAMLLMNGIPIERKAKSGTDPLVSVAAMLKEGDTLIFFPEGSRGKAGVVAPFRPGVGKLVHEVPGLLVVPVFLSGPERIWPRGEVVPVPLTIDVLVGRPRTYSAEDSTKEIADKVRDDVLTLAPSPPPVPGPRPEPPLRIAVCGLDHEARRELFRAITVRLGKIEPTMGVSEPVLEAGPDGVKEVTGPIPRAPGRAWFGVLAWLFRTSGWFKGDKFVRMVEQSQIDEAVEQGRATRFLVTDGSALVDVLAWALGDFYRGSFDDAGLNHLMAYLSGSKKIRMRYWWSYIRKAPEVWLVNVLDLANPPSPDILVLASRPIRDILERLRSTGAKLDRHENEPFLQRLQDGYGQVGVILSKRRKMELIEFDLSAVPIPEIAERVAEACRARLAAAASGP